MDMIDLTGDSDEEEASVPPKNKDANGNNATANNATVAANKRSGDGPISAEEMRRLRLQKFTGAANASTDQNPSAIGGYTKSEGKPSSMDIEPVQPTGLALSRSGRPMRYIIYMAVREGQQSQFAQGLELCKAACPEGMQNCLQMDGTRHCTMFDGQLTPDQVCNLSFDGDGFDPLEIEFEGWCPWDAGCYLQLTVESENALQDLLDRVEGLPLGGKRPCNHLSLYRKRQQTRHPNPKRAFAKIREATRSHNWGSVEGISIRIKEMGSPYEECIVLAAARPPEAGSTLQSAKQSFADEQTKPDLSEGSKAAEEKSRFRDHSTADSVTLSLVSWNVSEVSMSAVSNEAPCQIQRAQESANLIREECLRPHLDAQKQNGSGEVEAFLPDIVALQEVPDAGWSTAVFGPSGYVSKGTQHTHCGLVDLLVRKDWASTSIEFWRDHIERNQHSAFDEAYQQELPSVAAIITLPNNTQVVVASNHLEPFASGASARAHQCECLMEALTKRCSNVIIIGDMNMRQKEDRTTERLVGGGWIDAWKETGSRKDAKFTWNSFTNLYHMDGFGFTCRFDRCYSRGEDLSVKQFCLVGDQPVKGRAGDYLSDHYGIAVALDVLPTLDNDDVKVGAATGEEDVELDRKPAATSKKQAEDISNSTDDSSSDNGSSGSCGKLKSEEKCASNPDQAQERHCQRKTEEWSDDSMSADEITASQETRRVANGRRVQSETDAAKKARADSKQESESPRGRQKKPVKRSRFDSSSSDDDDDEAFLHAVNKNLGRVTKKKPKRRHLLDQSSSDEE
ncbi:hypothetical protein ACHAXT_006569 [Thalassiosira profunda]